MKGLNEWHLFLLRIFNIATERDNLAAKLVSSFVLLIAVKGGTTHL